MTEIEILNNIVSDYDMQLLDIEEEVAKAQIWLSAAIKERNMYRNNRSIVLDLIEKKTGIEIDKHLYDDDIDDDLSEYDN